MTEPSPAVDRGPADKPRKPRRTVHDRLLDAAYSLFTAQGIAQVGIDTVIAKSGCAKASLYNQFGSKEGLALAFLDLREVLWTRCWLEAEIMRRAAHPEERLLAVFELFDEWFEQDDFEGCSFVNVLLESNPGNPLRQSAAGNLRKIREILRSQAVSAGLADVEQFIQVWHMLMKGSIVSAGEGNREAAREAMVAAKILLEHWPRMHDTAADDA